MIATAAFGRTGHDSSRVIFGAAGLGEANQDEADSVLEVLLEHGVNHLDTAASYGDAELRMAPWMSKYRDRFFLATKTGERDGSGARASLERSLRRLGVERVDSIQLHNLSREDEWQAAFAPGGAVEALARARDEGLTRFIGVTGHGLGIAHMHLRSLDRFDFDSVLFPYNASVLADAAYRADAERLIALCIERRVAIQTIKAVARRPFPAPASPGERRLTWYEPLVDADAIGRAVRFVLSSPELFLISSGDWRLLPTILGAAAAFLEAAPGTEASRVPSKADLMADAERYEMEPIFTI